jgi:hypothetical protein
MIDARKGSKVRMTRSEETQQQRTFCQSLVQVLVILLDLCEVILVLNTFLQIKIVQVVRTEPGEEIVVIPRHC